MRAKGRQDDEELFDFDGSFDGSDGIRAGAGSASQSRHPFRGRAGGEHFGARSFRERGAGDGCPPASATHESLRNGAGGRHGGRRCRPRNLGNHSHRYSGGFVSGSPGSSFRRHDSDRRRRHLGLRFATREWFYRQVSRGRINVLVDEAI